MKKTRKNNPVPVTKAPIPANIKAILDMTPNTPGATVTIRQDLERLESDPGFIAEYLKAQFVEDVLKAMDEQGLNRNQLANRLGKSRQYVGRVLNETSNFTLDTLAEFACVLGMHVTVRLHSGKERADSVALTHPRPVRRCAGKTDFAAEEHEAEYTARARNTRSFVNPRRGGK